MERFDLATVATPVVPSARWSSSLVFDRSRRCFVLFGGFDPSFGLRNDTWEFDGTSWTQRNPSVAPSPRVGAACAFDPIRQRIVLHGGNNLLTGVGLGDTWEWDGTVWTAIPGRSPTPRFGRTCAIGGAGGSGPRPQQVAGPRPIWGIDTACSWHP